jgi:hypothetical protein
MDHRVVGLVGASGGLGTSSFAVALAARAGGALGVTVCVDAAGDTGAPSGGLDVTACLEHLPGLRWGDLADLQGTVDGAAVLRGLPGEGALRVLAARGRAPREGLVRDVVAALSAVTALTVLDLGTSVRSAHLCTDLVVLAGLTPRHLADAAALAAAPEVSGAAGPVARLLLRGARSEAFPAEEVAVQLDLPLAGVLRDDPRVRLDEARARAPGSRGRGALAEAVDRVLDELEASDDGRVERVGAATRRELGA